MPNLLNTIVAEIRATKSSNIAMQNGFELSMVQLSDCISFALFHNKEPYNIPNVYDYVIDCDTLEQFIDEYLPSIVCLASRYIDRLPQR